MKNKVLYSTLTIAAVTAALIAGIYLVLQPAGDDTSAPNGGNISAIFADRDNSAFGQSGLPDSTDKVNVSAWFPDSVTNDGSRELRVQLHIDEGWHVNANPASLESLIPTTVRARAGDQAVPLEVGYPPGRDSGIYLEGTTVQVYGDDAIINAVLTPPVVEAVRTAGALDIVVRTQSCSDNGICLAPGELTIRLPWS